MEEMYKKLGFYFGILLVIYLILNILFRKISVKLKGVTGENKVRDILNKLDKNKYIILNNIMLNTDKGLTQIDHIVLSIYGIFSIEIKNYKGKIYGNEYSQEWKQYINKKEFKFLNPIKQNYGHIKAIEELTDEKVISIIAISDNAEIKVRSKSEVINFKDLLKTIKKYNEQKYSFEEIKNISELIKSSNVDSKENRKLHLEQIEDKKTSRVK